MATDTNAPVSAEDAKAASQAKFASAVSGGVTAVLEPVLKDVGAALTGIQEILAAQKAPANIERPNPLEEQWKDVPAPATASLYKPPAPGDEGVRFARVCRALACGKHFSEVPRILSDKFHDRETAKLMEKSLATTTPSEGGLLVVDQFLAGEFIPLLREDWFLPQAGARFIPGPGGSVTIPGMASGASFSWVDETESMTDSTPGYDAVHLVAKKARAKVILSNDLREESSVEVDRMVLADMIAAVKEGLTRAALINTGSQKSPQGVKHNPRRNQVTCGAVTPDSPTAFIQALMDDKVAIEPSYSWIFNPAVWAFFYNLKTNTGDYHFRDEMRRGELAGHRFFTTTQISTASNITDIFFGDWRELLILDTKNFEVKIDPYNLIDTDQTALHLFHKTDMGLRQGLKIGHASDADIT